MARRTDDDVVEHRVLTAKDPNRQEATAGIKRDLHQHHPFHAWAVPAFRIGQPREKVTHTPGRNVEVTRLSAPIAQVKGCVATALDFGRTSQACPANDGHCDEKE